MLEGGGEKGAKRWGETWCMWWQLKIPKSKPSKVQLLKNHYVLSKLGEKPSKQVILNTINCINAGAKSTSGYGGETKAGEK